MMTETTIEPVRKLLTVDCSPEQAFATFTERINDWWPLRSHSVGGDEAENVRFEPGAEGRIVERLADGSEVVWAFVLDWDPPRRVRFSWHPGNDCARTQVHEATEVEITFTPAGEDGATRVELVHSGWERLGDRGAASRDNYDNGWNPVLGLYEGAADQAGSISR